MTAGKQQYEKIIMGIDPGTNIMGYGLIGCFGKKFDLIAMGVVKLDKYDNHALKLKTIYERVHGLIENFNPDELAIEAPFFGKNVQSMLKLGRAQGVAIAAALNREIPIFEYSPKSIKKAITGKGTASKEQVAEMLKLLAKYDKEPKYFDATDGLATAVCHFFQLNPRSFGSTTTKSTKTKKSSWEGFVKSNPKRIKKD